MSMSPSSGGDRFGSGHEMVLGPLKKYVFACNAFALERLRAAGREKDR
jgi:hypothetical protein